jgi:hypothetical protein
MMNFRDVSCSNTQRRSARTLGRARRRTMRWQLDSCGFCLYLSFRTRLRRRQHGVSCTLRRGGPHRMDLSRPPNDWSGCCFRVCMNACAPHHQPPPARGTRARDARSSSRRPKARPRPCRRSCPRPCSPRKTRRPRRTRAGAASARAARPAGPSGARRSGTGTAGLRARGQRRAEEGGGRAPSAEPEWQDWGA